MIKTKNAFTLAEVIVTLTVLGILAAIMLPTVSQARPNKQKILFKKAYHTAERMVYELVNDEDIYPTGGVHYGLDNVSEVQYNLVNYGSNDTGDAAEVAQKSKFCKLFARKVNTISDNVNCTGNNSAFQTTPQSEEEDVLQNNPSFITTDGIAWYMPYSDFKGADAEHPIATEQIYVDVNNSKVPNCQYNAETCPNPDRFTINIQTDGKMFVDGIKEKEYLMSNDSLR